MTRSATIAQARNQLPALVHCAEAGTPIELTRRGKPVAVLLSVVEYARLQGGNAGGFVEALALFRGQVDLAALDLAGALEAVRDDDLGREAPW